MPRRKKIPPHSTNDSNREEFSHREQTPRIKLTLRLLSVAMDPGKAELLEAIVITGSISAAGKSMQMSYRRVWLLVKDCNRTSIKPTR